MANYNFCEDIQELGNININCNQAKGYENIGWIVARRDVDFANSTKDEDNNLLITSIGLKAGAAFKWVGQLRNAFTDTTVSLEEGSFKNTFTNAVSFKVFNNSAEVTKIINALANGEYVMVLEQKEKDGELSTGVKDPQDESCITEMQHRTYRVFGWEQGLTASAIDQDNYSDDQLNGWSITLQETGASSAAYYMDATGFTDAKFPQPEC